VLQENKAVSNNDTEFWEKSYLRRSLTRLAPKHHACPLFLKDIYKEIISTGKSLQLIRHVPMTSNVTSPSGEIYNDLGGLAQFSSVNDLSFIGHGDHVYNYFMKDDFPSMIPFLLQCKVEWQNLEGRDNESSAMTSPRKNWVGFLDTILQEREASTFLSHRKGNEDTSQANELQLVKSFSSKNPVITVCQKLLYTNRDALRTLSLSKDANLPPLNDEDLREAVYNIGRGGASSTKQTCFTFGFQFTESQYLRLLEETKLLETIFPFPTLLPSYEVRTFRCQSCCLSKKIVLYLPEFSTGFKLLNQRVPPLPMVILQECLKFYIKKQVAPVDVIGSHMLSKLLRDWRLMDELVVLRAIYLLGSGDLLQHFLIIIFNKVDKGESWDDDFELNMILQSIRNSADAMILTAPDSLVVSITKYHGLDGADQHNSVAIAPTPHKGHERILGVNSLDVLNITYKVTHFLLKVKRAKFVLDKVWRWIWKVVLFLHLIVLPVF
ncbi:Gamma-tubulin complex component 5, partial [Bienertia sinuspersici]